MRTSKHDIVINKGSRYHPIFTWLTEDGDPAFTEDWAFLMDIRRSKGSAALITRLSSSAGSIVFNADAGSIRPDIKSSDTLNFEFEWAWYDLIAIPPSGTEDAIRISEGRVQLSDIVTRVSEISFEDSPILTLESTTISTITLQYTFISPAIGYEYRVNIGDPVDIGTENPFTIENLSHNTTYSIQIRGYDDVGFGPWSDAIEVTTEEPDITEPTSAPSIANITVTKDSADVSYGGVSGATSYEYTIDGGDIVVNIGTENPFTITSLQADTSYGLQMRARNEVGPGPWSSVETFLTLVDAPTDAPSITDIDIHLGSVDVTYTLVDGATSYEFELAEIGGGSILFQTTDNPVTISDLKDGTDYFIRVRAVTSGGEGPWSDSSVFTSGELPQAAPTIGDIEVTHETASVFRSEVDNSTGYEYRLDLSAAVDVEEENPFLVEGLDPDTQYNIEVRAYNQWGVGPWSTTYQFQTTVSPPEPGNNGAIQTTVTSTTLQADWTKATDPNDDPSLLEYHVYYSETDNISTVADAEANGILAHSATDIDTYTIENLSPSAGYFVNVIVENTAGVKAAYEMNADFTEEDPEVTGLTINEGDFTLTQNTNSSVNSEEFLITWETETISNPDDTATPVSSNTDVATVQKVSDYSALVSYAGEGQANITVTADNNSDATSSVTVTCLASTLYTEYESEISEFTTI
jgi:hypothetical protein